MKKRLGIAKFPWDLQFGTINYPIEAIYFLPKNRYHIQESTKHIYQMPWCELSGIHKK